VPGSSLDRASEAEGNVVPSAPQYSMLSIQAQRERLPIFNHRQKLLYAVEQFGVIIVVGQTGCGKTTRNPILAFCPCFADLPTPPELPQYLLETGWATDGMVIACTQPRRVAATSVASRVTTEVGSVLGDEVQPNFCLHVPFIYIPTGWIYHSL
jgi:ATP-dependent RNA helicase DDX35